MSTSLSSNKPNYREPGIWNIVWNRPYVNYEKHHQVFWNLIKKDAAGKILDLACGSASCWRGVTADLTGVDFSEAGILEARKNFPSGQFLVRNIFDLPLSFNNRFDTVVLSGLVNYYNDDDLFRLLKKVKRVVKKGGKVIVTINVINDFPNRTWDVPTIRDRFELLGRVKTRFYKGIGWYVTIVVD